MQTGVRKDLLQVQQDLIIFESSCNKKKTHLSHAQNADSGATGAHTGICLEKGEKELY